LQPTPLYCNMLNFQENSVCKLFGIKLPIVQGGMVWVSGWKLAAAVSAQGGLGLIGAGSMYPELLETHIQKCKAAGIEKFGVNLPLLYPHAEAHVEVIIRNRVPVVFTSAGNPALYTQRLKAEGITVVHVIANEKFALKALDAGVDALVAEGFEAGGHNGKEETTTLVLIPQIRKICPVPLLAAGGIASGQSMLAALALGADGVQIGSAFAVCEESSAHTNYKEAVFQSKEGDTQLTLKELTPVRMLKNELFNQLEQAKQNGASKEELKAILGKGRARKGILEGDLQEGELEIGQVAMQLKNSLSVEAYIKKLLQEVEKGLVNLNKIQTT